jgi:hypothetical protein
VGDGIVRVLVCWLGGIQSHTIVWYLEDFGLLLRHQIEVNEVAYYFWLLLLWFARRTMEIFGVVLDGGGVLI